MPTKYGHSPWLDAFPKARVPAYPQHRGTQNVDAVIVGGGLTGCLTAYAFAAAGVKVVLLEANRLGQGTTLGAKPARQAFQLWRRSALDFIALLRRLDVKCALEAQPSITAALTADQAARLKREQKMRRAAGLDAPLLAPRVIKPESGLDAISGLRARDGAVLDPYRACLGIAAAAKERGAAIFERSAVRKITFTRKSVEVFSASGSLRAKRAIIATGIPTPLFKSLARHFWFRTRYLALTEPVPARIRQQLGRRTTVVGDAAEPPHVVRWIDRARMLVAGADGDAVPERLRAKTIIQRTGQLMYELSTMYPDVSGVQPSHGWATNYARTTDGLPYLGPHRNFPWHLFAFGDASHSVTGAYLASRVLLRHYSDEMDPADNAFAFHR
jgi:glycine/D-amino acid oxidase-like deaminating enzyme